MAERCIIFGGTSEGRELSETAAANGWETHVYVATGTGADFLGSGKVQIHVGRLTAEEMAEEIRRIGPHFVLDATHPYATEVTAHIRSACEVTGCERFRIRRETVREAGDLEAADADEAAELLKTHFPKEAVLLTTGSKELPAFRDVIAENPEVYVRILPGEENTERALDSGVEKTHILEGVGPFSEEENLRVLRQFKIRALVTKESGTRGGYAEKLHAAKKAGCRVIVIRRPAEEAGITQEEAKMLLAGRKSGRQKGAGV